MRDCYRVELEPAVPNLPMRLGPWNTRRFQLFLFISIIAIFPAGLRYRRIGDSRISYSFIDEHPIPFLMASAEREFQHKLSEQSRTLEAAVMKYKAKYKQPPPRGFDKWWKFTQENNILLVDEYDSIIEDLAPFWKLNGTELRRRATQVGE